MHERSKLGQKGEGAVQAFLEREGFMILTKNYRLRTAEIDLIARKKDLVVFVEVKTRSHEWEDFDLSNVITPSKQRKIVVAAKNYIVLHNLDDIVCRFDVAFVYGNDTDARLTYFEDAFHDER